MAKNMQPLTPERKRIIENQCEPRPEMDDGYMGEDDNEKDYDFWENLGHCLDEMDRQTQERVKKIREEERQESIRKKGIEASEKVFDRYHNALKVLGKT